MSSKSEPLNHPSHLHHLYLTNIQNSVLIHYCNACRLQINDFYSYRCGGRCNFDLHITCASMPLSVTHPSHDHQLFLIFSPTYDNKKFTCDICKTVGYNHWLYQCKSYGCRFDAHLGCIHSPNIQQTHMQSNQSIRTANEGRYQPAGVIQQFPTGPRPRPRPWPPFPAGPPNNYANHGHEIVRPSGLGSGWGNDNVMAQANQGFINGAAHSVGGSAGQGLLGDVAFAGTNNIWGGGSNDYGGNGGGGGGDGGPSNDYGGNDASSF